MKIAVPASGPTVESQVDTRFGRAPYFIILSQDTNEVISVTNSLNQESGGVGPRIVQLLVQHEVTHLISPRIGMNAETALVAAGILVFLYEGSGTVFSALKEFEAGKLSLISEKFKAM